MNNRLNLSTPALALTLYAGLVADLARVYALTDTVHLGGHTLYDSESFRYPVIWIWATAIAVGSAIITGGLALAEGCGLQHRKGVLTALAILLGATGLHWYFSYDALVPLSELLGLKSPLIWLAALILFKGMDDRSWPSVNKFIFVSAYLYSFLVLSTVLTLDVSTRAAALRALGGYAPLLLVTAPYIIIVSLGRSFPWVVASYIPLAAYFAVGVFTGTRSTVLLSLAIILICYLAARRMNIQAISGLSALMSLMTGAFVVGVAIYFLTAQSVQGLEILIGRLDEDSRTEQYREFFSQVALTDLLLGTGPTGAYIFGGRSYGYVDGTYLFLLFYGGVPVLFAYIWLIMRPGLRAVFFVTATQLAIASGLPIVVWAVAFLGLSTYSAPDLTVGHWIYCIFAGRCMIDGSPPYITQKQPA